MGWLDKFFSETTDAEPPIDSERSFVETTSEVLADPAPVEEVTIDQADVQAAPEPLEPEEIPDAPVDELAPPEFPEQGPPADPEFSVAPEADVPPPPEFETPDWGVPAGEEPPDAALLEQADEWVNANATFDPRQEQQVAADDLRGRVRDMVDDGIREQVDPLRFI